MNQNARLLIDIEKARKNHKVVSHLYKTAKQETTEQLQAEMAEDIGFHDHCISSAMNDAIKAVGFLRFNNEILAPIYRKARQEAGL